MLVCDYIGSSYPGGKGAHKKFYALLPRSQSDEFTRSLVNLMVNNGVDCPEWSLGVEPYTYFSGLPANDPSHATLGQLQVSAFFSKNDDMRSGIDREAVAFESFLRSEFSCRTVNSELSKGIGRINTRECKIIRHYAARFISDVLCDVPSFEDLDFTFGPGANVSSRGDKHTSPNVKLSGKFTVSNSLVPKLGEIRPTLPHLGDFHMVCGRLEFVSKNFKTMRSILLESNVNSAFQKGVGKVIKHQLQLIGLLTKRAQEHQRERARLGSSGHDWVTIDLSRASDSVAWGLVLDLLPPGWFDLLDALRTPLARYKGKLIELEKFSSMGNGYTFELETLIFKALIRGIAAARGLKDDSLVYGDDITCNAELGRAVVELLPEFGFEVNRDKSFVDGPFREACGGDYRLGVDVRPWFLRSLRDGGRWNIAKMFSFYNFLKRKPQFDYGLTPFILAAIPDHMKIYGPDGFGDGHLLTDQLEPWEEGTAYYNTPGFWFHTYTATPYKVPQEAHPALPAYVSYNQLSADGEYGFDECRYPKGILLVSTRKRIYVTGESRELRSVDSPDAIRRRDLERKARITADRVARGYCHTVDGAKALQPQRRKA